MKRIFGFLLLSTLAVTALTPQVQAQGSVNISPPVLRATSIASNELTVAWDAVASATGYQLDASAWPFFGTVISPPLHEATVATVNDLNGWTSTYTTSGTTASGMVLTQGNLAVSPLINLTGVASALFTFEARTYYGINELRNRILVEITTNNTDWVKVGEFTPQDNTFNNHASMSLEAWCGHSITLRMTTPDSTTQVGAGVRAVRVSELIPDFLPGYKNHVPSGTSAPVLNLTPLTTYYFRARSVDSTGSSTNSTTLAVTTLPQNIPAVATPTVTSVTHESASLAWGAVVNAASYEIEICKTNSFLNIGTSRVIITKVLYGANSNKIIELTNIGNIPANLLEYSLNRSTTLAGPLGSSVFYLDQSKNTGTAICISTNGASFSLNAGHSISLVFQNASDNSLKTEPHLFCSGNSTPMNFSNDNRFELYHNSLLVDYGCSPSNNNRVMVRNIGVMEGAAGLTQNEWTSQWTEVTGYNSTLGNYFLLVAPYPFYYYIPAFPNILTPTAATTFKLPNLRPRTVYFARVRGCFGTATGGWSPYVSFTTLAPPKKTVFMVR